MADNSTTTPKQKVQFWRGKELKNPADGNGEIVFINNTMGETGPADEKDKDAWDIDKKLGSIYQDDKIVGTTKADELCLTDNLKVTRTDVEIGKVTQNFEFKKGMSLTDILKELFCETYDPTYNGSYTLKNVEAISFDKNKKPETKDGDTIYILPGDSTTLVVPDYMSDGAWDEFNRSIEVLDSTNINESKCVDGSVYVTHYTKDSDGNAVETNVTVGKYFTGPNYTTPSVIRTTSRNQNDNAKENFETQEIILSKGVPSSTTYTYTRTDSYAVTTPSTGTSYGVKWPADSTTGDFINKSTFITNNDIKNSDLKVATKIDGYPETPYTPDNKNVTFNAPESNTFTYTYKVQSVLPVTIDGVEMGKQNGTHKGITSSSVSKQIYLTTDRQWNPDARWTFNITSYSTNGEDIDIQGVTSDWESVITIGNSTFNEDNKRKSWVITVGSKSETIGANATGTNGPTFIVTFKNTNNN